MSNTLQTDGYKFSMAQAGFPLRPETFYFSFRKGGWQYISFDLEEAIKEMLPFIQPGEHDIVEELGFLEDHGYSMTGAMISALHGTVPVEIKAAPKGTWVYEREPIVTVTGPSFVVSWLEPLILRLFFPIQLATAIKNDEATDDMFLATCEEQAEIMRRVIKEVLPNNPAADALNEKIKVEPDKYFNNVTAQAKQILEIVKDPTRLFEVGMRAATCEGQHRICLKALREQGIMATSNVALARELDMKPVGTMGHEHVQRWGNDLDAYRAMRDMRVDPPSYLLDTTDTLTSGIPNAIKVMKEVEHESSIRYDSGDIFGQYIYAHGEFKRRGLEPMHVLEDGLSPEAIVKFENLRKHTELPPEKQIYGAGGLWVSRHWANPLTRDRVSAVYKLTQTSGEPRMKWGNEDGIGKQSIPGHPVTWRRLRGSGPMSIIGQDGETVAENYMVLNGNPEAIKMLTNCNVVCEGEQPYTLSPETTGLVRSLRRN